MIDKILFRAIPIFSEQYIESHSILQGKENTFLRNETDDKTTWIKVQEKTVQVFTDYDSEGNKIWT
jgi:hypothetical protein